MNIKRLESELVSDIVHWCVAAARAQHNGEDSELLERVAAEIEMLRQRLELRLREENGSSVSAIETEAMANQLSGVYIGMMAASNVARDSEGEIGFD